MKLKNLDNFLFDEAEELEVVDELRDSNDDCFFISRDLELEMMEIF